MKKFTLIFLVFSHFILTANAQLMDGKKSFTRKDTLRGFLSAERVNYDVKHYLLDIKIDIEKKYIKGTNQITFDVINDLPVLQFDLFENMNVDKVEWNNKKLKFYREFNAVFVKFPEALKKGTNHSIIIYYEGNPTIAKRAPWDGGLVFKKDKNGKPWVGVACQGTGASLWWPNKDHQSDEPDSMEIRVTSPSDLEEVSNGRLVSKVDLNNGYTKRIWKVNHPINNYNVSINIADYYHWTDNYTSKINSEVLTLDYYVLKDNEAKARKQFEQVKPMLDAFEKRFSPYPFYKDGYKLVETPYLGMEHQSCVAYGNAYKNGYMGFDMSGSGEGLKFDYIIIHETAHEWWGNSLTTYDIADMWIHEGFGQYSEIVYLEELYGKESAIKYLKGIRGGIQNKEPIIGPYGVNEEGSGDMYPKGAQFLHTLRSVINNDELWWSIIYDLQVTYKHKNLNTEDVLNFMNNKAGQNLNKLFDQYLKHPAIPELEWKSRIENGNLIIEYNWLTDVKDFEMPIEITVHGKTERLLVKNEKQTLIYTKSTIEDVLPDKTNFYYKIKKGA
jgi:aminopeptidase N